MTVALIIFLSLVLVGAVLYLHHRLTSAHEPEPIASGEAQPSAANAEGEDGECCGMHIACEKDSLLAAVSKDIEYYDDEELDRFRGRGANEYAEAEIEEFRDVLLTLLAEDIAGWARSLQLRSIELPAPVKDELLMIVREEREKRAVSA